MTDKRKLAVSYGSFSCVIEGFDDPFTLMRDIISFYYQVSQEEPEFAHFHQIVDMEELKALLERDMGEQIELEPIAGGVYARRIELPARLAGDAAPQAAAAEGSDDADADEAHHGPGMAAAAAAGLATAAADDAEADQEGDAAIGQDEGDQADSEEDAYPEDAFLEEAYSGDTFQDDDGYAAEEGWHDQPDEEDEPDAEEADSEQAREPDEESNVIALVNDGEVSEDDTAQDTGEAAEDERDDAGDEGHRAGEDHSEAEDDRHGLAKDEFRFHETAEAAGDDAGEAHRDRHEDETPEDAPAAAADHAAQDGDTERDDEETEADDEGAEAQDEAPIGLHDALDGGAAQHRPEDGAEHEGEDDAAEHRPAASGPGPIRLSDAMRSSARGEPEDDDEKEDGAAEPGPHDRLTLGAALRLGPRDEVAAEDASGEEDDDEDSDQPAGAFIDRVAEQDETRELLTTPAPRRRKLNPDEETPVDVSIAQIRSDIAAAEDEKKPKKSGGLMGNLLRRRSPAQDSGKDSVAEPEADRAAEAPGTAEKPRSLSSGRLRVIRSGTEDDTAAAERDDASPRDAGPDAPRAREEAPEPPAEPEAESARDAAPEPPAPEPQREPAESSRAAPADAAPRRAEREARGGGALADRLHASFDSRRAASGSKDVVDLTGGEMQDPYSPRGFAQRVGAGSAPELIAAAAAFRILVDGKTSVSRTDIMETVQMIMGDKPLSAEAKVKAFGKLVRGGELSRVDGGEFALSPEALESHQQRFDTARKSNAAGG